MLNLTSLPVIFTGVIDRSSFQALHVAMQDVAASDCAWEFVFSEVYFSVHRLMSVVHGCTFQEKEEFLLKISVSVHFIICMLINTEAREIISVFQVGT